MNVTVPTPKRQPRRPRRFRFNPNDRIRYRGQDYVYVREIEGGHAFRLHPGGIEQCVTDAEMQGIVEDPTFALDRGHYSEAAATARSLAGATSLADLPPWEREEIMRKVYYCRRFLEMERERQDPNAERVTRSDDSMERAIGRIEGEIASTNARAEHEYPQRKDRKGEVPRMVRGRPTTPRTFRKWLRVYEAAPGYPIALRDRRRLSGNRKPRLHPEVYRLIHEACETYASEKRPTIEHCHKLLCEAVEKLSDEMRAKGMPGLERPSQACLRRAICALPVFRTYARRHGIDAARRRYRLVKQPFVVVRPGERIEMDEWTIHLHKILKKQGLWPKLSDDQKKLCTGRWLVCAAIEVATKTLPAVMMAPTASASLSMRTLEMVLLDKAPLAPGIESPWDMAFRPDSVFTDAGPGFNNSVFPAAVTDLRARHNVPPGGMPHLRAAIERTFRDLDVSLLPHFTGRTFSDPSEKGDHDPQLRASISTEAFARALCIHIADVYHDTPHDGLGGETPRNAWARLTEEWGVSPPPNAHDRRAIFGTEMRRKLSLRGVRLLGLHFSDKDLGQHILEEGLSEVRIRVDERDLGHVSLWTGDGWRPLPCRTRGFDGVTVPEYLAALADVRRRHAKANLVTRRTVLEAVARIRDIAARAEAEAGIILQVLGPERIEAEETELLQGFDIDVDGDDDPDDLALEFIPTGPDGDPPGGSHVAPSGSDEAFVDHGSFEED